MAEILDITHPLTDSSVDWTVSGKEFISQAPLKGIAGIKQGLYAILYRNSSSTLPIRDRNSGKKKSRRRPCGMVVVEKGGCTLKYGKFEDGIANRHELNHKHLHHCSKQEVGTFCPKGYPLTPRSACGAALRWFLVLNLTDYHLAPTGRGGKLERIEKERWNPSIREFLREHQCVRVGSAAQKGNSESRYLTREPALDHVKKVLSGLADDIILGLEKSPRRLKGQ